MQQSTTATETVTVDETPAGDPGRDGRRARRGRAGRGGLDRRHVRRLLSAHVPETAAPARPVEAVRPGRRLAVAPPGVDPSGALRRPALPLRNPSAVLPQDRRCCSTSSAGLASAPDAREACLAAGVAPDQLPPYRAALTTLASSQMIRRSGPRMTTAPLPLVEQFQFGLDAPICLTWELTYACNLSCVHCLSSSGRRDPRELTTDECKAVIDELERMQVFYVNIGGGEPTVRSDFWELVDYATEHHVGVKFSTNGVKITPEVAQRLAASDYVDVQISLDGATAEVNDAVRGPGSYATAMRAMQNLADAGFKRLQDLGRHDAAERRPARRVQGHRRPVRRPAAHHPAAPVRPRRRRLGRAARRPPSSSASSTTGWSRNGENGADRRLVLPPRRLRRRRCPG